MRPLPIAVRRLWRAVAAGQAVVLALALGVADIALRTRVDLGWPPVLGPVVLGLVVGVIGVVVAEARYRTWRYELTDEWVQARWGVIGRHTATVPRNRVQTVTSENGPIDRMLGLTSLTIHTAGSGAPNLGIPHLDDETVEWLRSELARGSLG